jgi:outer membrane receptor protein involved in Fe transport
MEAGPRHIANSRITYSPTRASAVSAEWANVGWYFTDPENKHRYDGYDVLNLEAATPPMNGFSLVGRLANVANKRYSVATSFNPFVPADQQDRYTPGLLRTLYLGLQYKRPQ